MTEIINLRESTTLYSKGIIDGVVSILKEYCFEGKARTDGELDNAIRLFVLDTAYSTGVDINVNEVVDSIYETVDEFMSKFDTLNEKKQ